MRKRVLRRPVVFLRVRCSIFVRCSVLILLIKIVRCSIPHCICMYISDITPYLHKTLTWPYQEICTENKCAFLMWFIMRPLISDVRFQSRALVCRYVMAKVELGQVFLRMLRFYPFALIPSLLHALSCTEPRGYKNSQ
jgi:hypothetical protein